MLIENPLKMGRISLFCDAHPLLRMNQGRAGLSQDIPESPDSLPVAVGPRSEG